MKDTFCNQLDSVIQTIKQHDILIILGDLNAVSGQDTPSPLAVLYHCRIIDDNTERLRTLSRSHGLTIMGSSFRRLNIHQWTWESHDGKTKKEIDHFIVRQRDQRLFKSYRVYRGAECPANTNYRLVVAALTAQPYTARKRQNAPKSDVQCLSSEATVQQHFHTAV